VVRLRRDLVWRWDNGESSVRRWRERLKRDRRELERGRYRERRWKRRVSSIRNRLKI
jgi:hypothetical protein